MKINKKEANQGPVNESSQKPSNMNKILRNFSEVKSIKVQVGNQYVLLEDSPGFIRHISPNVNYLVKYQDGSVIQCVGNKVQELMNGQWRSIN